jgi:uncharacterized protein YdeI (YjbR/CyaY-like superfamily)
MTDQTILEFADASAWEQWLQQHNDSAEPVWLKLAKRGASRSTVSYAEAVEVSLCYGWIDSQKARFDESFSLQRFSRRGRRSKWSQINRQKAEALIETGAMRPAGRREVEAARADGRWDAAYPGQSAATVPDDFQRALEANPDAERFFATLTSANRYAFLFRLHNIKRAETRAKRIADYVELLSAGKTLH